jgi:Mg-chelatase subunit ChlI
MKRNLYPFSAIVGQEAMKTALLLNAVDPTIGGVLIRGQKGTGKSTAARALASLLPTIEVVEGCAYNSDPRHPFIPAALTEAKPSRRPVKSKSAIPSPCAVLRPTPFVELPLNATEDRLAGTLHLEKALKSGQRQFEPGLLAAANRGILYVDEVNLLDDHLVDLLLDAAASGVNVVERESLSFAHPSRFMLVGTMNPEEGELRPQFLDRFGLCVTADQITNAQDRQAIVRQRLSFESNPEAFEQKWINADNLLAEQIIAARARIEGVVIPEAALALTVHVSSTLGTQGHRADITILKAARAHAALLEKKQVEAEDVAEAAKLALPHRINATALDSPEKLLEKISQAFNRTEPDQAQPRIPDGAEQAEPEEDMEEWLEQMQIPGSMAAGSVLFTFIKKKTKPRSMMPTPH